MWFIKLLGIGLCSSHRKSKFLLGSQPWVWPCGWKIRAWVSLFIQLLPNVSPVLILCSKQQCPAHSCQDRAVLLSSRTMPCLSRAISTSAMLVHPAFYIPVLWLRSLLFAVLIRFFHLSKMYLHQIWRAFSLSSFDWISLLWPLLSVFHHCFFFNINMHLFTHSRRCCSVDCENGFFKKGNS